MCTYLVVWVMAGSFAELVVWGWVTRVVGTYHNLGVKVHEGRTGVKVHEGTTLTIVSVMVDHWTSHLSRHWIVWSYRASLTPHMTCSDVIGYIVMS